MIAYNRTALDNRDIQTQAREALAKKILTQQEFDGIRSAYPCTLYTPNFFIRAGLFLLTLLAVLCCFWILLIIGLHGDSQIGGELIFFGVLAYIALELFIHLRRMYRSGVDDALLWVAGGLIVGGINLTSSSISPAMESLVVLIFALVGTIRYADRLMTVIAYGALLSLIFCTVGTSAAGRAALPFVVMAVSVVLYISFTRWTRIARLRFYHSNLPLLRTATLLSLYAAGNYYIVRSVNESLSHQPGPVRLGFLWWILTALLPIVYIILGIRKKDVIFLWTGLALVAASAFTLRYYYHVLPAELAMIIGGCVVIVGAWSLIRYLHTPKSGLTSLPSEDPHLLKDLPIEGVILAESFQSVAHSTDPGFQYGGGTTGGGGAGGGF